MSHSSNNKTEKPWVKNYAKDVPENVDVTQYSSCVEIFESSFQQFKDRPAFTCMGVTYTYGHLDRLSQDFANYLSHKINLKKGDRIAVMMPNILQYPIAIIGALRAGLVVVNVNPLYTPRELGHQLKDSGAKVIVVVENFAHVLAEVINETQVQHVLTTKIGDCLGLVKGGITNFVIKYVKKMIPPFNLPGAKFFLDALVEGRKCPTTKMNMTLNDIAFLQYTGGTTGVSKGAVLTHGNLVANVTQAHAWIQHDLVPGKEIILTALPLYHIFSLTANCLTFMKLGGHNILIPNPRDMVGFIKIMKTYPFTAFTAVNTLFNALMNHPDFNTINFSTMKFSLAGGMAVQKAVADRWKSLTGKAIIQAYGLTETSPAACINPLTAEEFTGSIGLPISSTLVSIRDDDNIEVPVGKVGEIWIKGPQVMQGYWQRPEETAKVLTEDGWLKTGDLGFMAHSGYFTIVDRKKDMIIVSGFNVYPNEIEDVVVSHPKVLEVAAIGIPDQHSGEVVKIYIVKKEDSLTEKEIIDYCRTQLTGYKVPKYVEFKAELPKTNVGKILRRALKEADPLVAEKSKGREARKETQAAA